MVLRRLHGRMGDHSNDPLQSRRRRRGNVRSYFRIWHGKESGVRRVVLGSALREARGFFERFRICLREKRENPNADSPGRIRRRRPPGAKPVLYRGLKRYNVPAAYVLYPREPHAFQEAKHRVDVQNRVIAWFMEYLKGEKPKEAPHPPAMQSGL